MKLFIGIIKSIRPHQWIKNLFLFAGIIFSGQFFYISALERSTAGFIAFCAMASGIYLLNDVKDLDADHNHPDKRDRPIASGLVPLPLAITLGILLLISGLLISFALGHMFLLVGGGYVLLQILYIFLLKRLPILDILAVSAGFVIRAAAGGVVIDVPISSWLLVCTSLLALFLVTEKRRQELARIEREKSDISSRPSLRNYSVSFLDNLSMIEIAATTVAYMLYVFSLETRVKFGYWLGATIPFVFYGLFRYLWLVHQKGKGEAPEKIFLTDFPSIINLILWGVTAFVVVYFT